MDFQKGRGRRLDEYQLMFQELLIVLKIRRDVRYVWTMRTITYIENDDVVGPARTKSSGQPGPGNCDCRLCGSVTTNTQSAISQVSWVLGP